MEVALVNRAEVKSILPFNCESISRSSLVKRLCYDSRERYVIVNLTGTYYHCEVSAIGRRGMARADSMGRFSIRT